MCLNKFAQLDALTFCFLFFSSIVNFHVVGVVFGAAVVVVGVLLLLLLWFLWKQSCPLVMTAGIE